MSDYKEVETQVELTNQEQLIEALETVMPGIQIQTDVVATNRWQHKHQLAIVVAQDQLPEPLQGFGDLGFTLKNGKFVPIGCQPDESHYIDNDKGQEVGTFVNLQNSMFKDVENTYALLGEVRSIAQRVPGVQFGSVEHVDDAEDQNAMGVRVTIPAALVAQLQARLRV